MQEHKLQGDSSEIFSTTYADLHRTVYRNAAVARADESDQKTIVTFSEPLKADRQNRDHV
jgi:hypothetical protein